MSKPTCIQLTVTIGDRTYVADTKFLADPGERAFVNVERLDVGKKVDAMSVVLAAPLKKQAAPDCYWVLRWKGDSGNEYWVGTDSAGRGETWRSDTKKRYAFATASGAHAKAAVWGSKYVAVVRVTRKAKS